ncbi:MAG: hypothetical protein U9N77_04250 [Thermodesulfobacteriota bacterium]|nr:hypothetical protein [Thermodesulfobacteriota bacterium]
MMNLFSIEFWVCIQFFIDLIFVIILLVFVKRLKKESKDKTEPVSCAGKMDRVADQAKETAREIIAMLEPLVAEAEAAAKSFDGQIKEKKTLINGVNDALDSRIISINLLLSRADALYRAQKDSRIPDSAFMHNHSQNVPHNPAFMQNSSQDTSRDDVVDQQKNIIELYNQGFGIEAIASKLAMPKGEVQLVVNLKRKFLKMENQE